MSEHLLLVEPHIRYKDSFNIMVAMYAQSGETHYFDKYKAALIDFEQYIFTLSDEAKGQDDWVPSHSFWLTDESGSILGVIRIRTSLAHPIAANFAGHIGYDIAPSYRNRGYGKVILRLGLEKAKALGLERILITCLSENLASSKVIEANGGIFESEIIDIENNEQLKRYWIAF